MILLKHWIFIWFYHILSDAIKEESGSPDFSNNWAGSEDLSLHRGRLLTSNQTYISSMSNISLNTNNLIVFHRIWEENIDFNLLLSAYLELRVDRQGRLDSSPTTIHKHRFRMKFIPNTICIPLQRRKAVIILFLMDSASEDSRNGQSCLIWSVVRTWKNHWISAKIKI